MTVKKVNTDAQYHQVSVRQEREKVRETQQQPTSDRKCTRNCQQDEEEWFRLRFDCDRPNCCGCATALIPVVCLKNKNKKNQHKYFRKIQLTCDCGKLNFLTKFFVCFILATNCFLLMLNCLCYPYVFFCCIYFFYFIFCFVYIF